MLSIAHTFRSWRVGLMIAVSAAIALGTCSTHAEENDVDHWGVVYTLTNDPYGNELAAFDPDGNGGLKDPVFYATNGLGFNAGIGSQGALALSHHREYLYAVNPGSSTIAIFRLERGGPRFIKTVSSGGKHPISLTVHKDLLYVLNAGSAVAGGTDSIAGFKIGHDGSLKMIVGSIAYLSAGAVAPAEISFDAEGGVLTVSEKGTNLISLFPVNKNSLPGARESLKSSGPTPFGFAYTSHNLLVVSEADGGAANASTVSSYRLDPTHVSLKTVSASINANQSAACWIAITANNQFAYAANTGSATITGFKVGGGGTLTLLESSGVAASAGKAPADLAIQGNRKLYVLNGGDGTVGAYDIGHDGALKSTAVVGGLPPTHPAGLVVR